MKAVVLLAMAAMSKRRGDASRDFVIVMVMMFMRLTAMTNDECDL